MVFEEAVGVVLVSSSSKMGHKHSCALLGLVGDSFPGRAVLAEVGSGAKYCLHTRCTDRCRCVECLESPTVSRILENCKDKNRTDEQSYNLHGPRSGCYIAKC